MEIITSQQVADLHLYLYIFFIFLVMWVVETAQINRILLIACE